ncbi:MAG: UDP-glucose/GDP-mannose dehydrogenase family protein, partial [Deltaproteobacteria bacterium]|nr:UDP-glucose/GDP-mannose dehydrogenase family protein [Deltaproteobacteria bacterium]
KNIHKKLIATTDFERAIFETDISFIAVGTPLNGKEIDLTFIKNVSRQIAEVIKDKDAYHMVVMKSTVVPGTTDDIILPILEESSGKKAGVDFGIGMNPEFLREGEAIQDFMVPDRIVMGSIDKKGHELLEEVYGGFKDVPKIKTTNKTAEMIKYTSNSLFATMISFSNEIGNLCASLGDIDVKEVMEGVHLDKRLSCMSHGERIVPSFTTYIEAGCGFGGSCFPKDVKALISHGKMAGRQMDLLEAVIRVNEQQPFQVVKLLEKHFTSLNNVNVAILGLAFKPGTDDMRESPAIPIVKYLKDQGSNIKVYDPVANNEAQKLFGNDSIVYCDAFHQTIEKADVIVLLTAWEEFKELPKLLADLDAGPLVIDGRRMLNKRQITHYEGIGLQVGCK